MKRTLTVKRTLTLMVVASLFAGPAMAVGPDGPDKKELTEAAIAAAREIVKEEAKALAWRPPVATPLRQDGGGGWKTAAGIALIAAGAGVIAKGVSVYESEPDPFGRTKNTDAYLAYGVGSAFMVFGVLALRGGLAGRGFNE